MDCEATDNRASWPWAVLKGDTWKQHGQQVASMHPYIPESFDATPRNPAEKINSGYKAWEFLLYVFGLGPCVFAGLIPNQYWTNFCMLVRGMRILLQEEIDPAELREAHTLITKFSDGFEALYVQRRPDRLHFVRPSIHSPSHMAPETMRVGPSIIFSQWSMETIGNLGEEIRQPSNPFSNFAQHGLIRSQINALKAMAPDLDPDQKTLPRGAKELGDGFVLLRATDTAARPMRQVEALAFHQFLQQRGLNPGANYVPKVLRWARLSLPNGQIARSKWKEESTKYRISRNVKVSIVLVHCDV